MIRHCVFVRFRKEVGRGERGAILADIAALKQRLSGIPEAGMDKGFAEGFIVDFRDAAARDAYLIDPAHQAAGGQAGCGS